MRSRQDGLRATAVLQKTAAMAMLLGTAGFYGMASSQALWILVPLLIVAAFAARASKLLLLAVSTVLVTGLLLGVCWLAAPLVQNAIMYRPFEMLQMFDAENDVHYYRPNARVIDFDMSYGDLVPFVRGRTATETVLDAQPRTLSYRIDDLGFRNDQAYAGEPWILVGDSFVAGDDNDQLDTLANQLRRDGVSAYAVAHPGDPPDYVKMTNYFVRKKSAPAAQVILFVFEGNDFDYSDRLARSLASSGPAAVSRSSSDTWFASARRWQRSTGLYRLTFSVISRLYYGYFRLGQQDRDMLLVETVGGQRMGFLGRHVGATRSPEADVALEGEILARVWEPLQDRLAAVVFIPAKYRVYRPLFAAEEAPPLPERAWRIAQEACGRLMTVCHDLTPALQSRAHQLLETGDFVYWKDDTHWNREGIAVAAEWVSQWVGSAAIRSHH